jgi:hypothetical protein
MYLLVTVTYKQRQVDTEALLDTGAEVNIFNLKLIIDIPTLGRVLLRGFGGSVV